MLVVSHPTVMGWIPKEDSTVTSVTVPLPDRTRGGQLAHSVTLLPISHVRGERTVVHLGKFPQLFSRARGERLLQMRHRDVFPGVLTRARGAANWSIWTS